MKITKKLNLNFYKNKVNIADNLEIERKEDNYNKYKEADFIPNDYKWTNIEEQKIKVEEIEKKTNKKNNV